jgi:hypothetical protein
VRVEYDEVMTMTHGHPYKTTPNALYWTDLLRLRARSSMSIAELRGEGILGHLASFQW